MPQASRAYVAHESSSAPSQSAWATCGEGGGIGGGFTCSDARLRAHARARAYVPCRGGRTAQQWQHAHPCPGPARSPQPWAPIPLRLRARNRHCMHISLCGVYEEFIRSLYGVYTGPSVTIYASPHQIQGPQPRGGSGCGPGRGPFTPSGRPAICMHTVIRSRPRSVSYRRYTLRHEAGMGAGGQGMGRRGGGREGFACDGDPDNGRELGRRGDAAARPQAAPFKVWASPERGGRGKPRWEGE